MKEETKETVLKLKNYEYSPVNYTGIIERDTGSKYWYLNGQFHREDGPAVEYADGTKSWWLNGKLHRVDGPARELSDGSKHWYLNGELHRTDGPACEWPDGDKHWYLNGEYHRVDGPAVEDADGSKSWFLNGKLHRVDGPARELADGYREWWLNGKLHRVDGPAVERADGSKSWYLNGKYHREDGPAVERADGSKDWYLNGEFFSEQDFNAKMFAKGMPSDQATKPLTTVDARHILSPSKPTVANVAAETETQTSGEQKMSKMEVVKQVALSDAKVVGYRVAASQMTKVITNAVIKMLSGNMKGRQLTGFRKTMTEFFETSMGKSLMMFFIGCSTPYFIKYVPEKYREHAYKIAEAARHEAEFTVASQLVDSLTPILSMAGGSMMSALNGIMDSSSSESSESNHMVRVSATSESSGNHSEEMNVSAQGSTRRAVGA